MVCGLVCCPETPGSGPAQMWVVWDIGNLVGTGRNDRGLQGPMGHRDPWSLGGGRWAVNKADSFDVHWTNQGQSPQAAEGLVERSPT